MGEMWDLVDENRNKTGVLHERGSKQKIPDGMYHVVVEIWVKTPEGKLLLTKRHPDKKYGLLWECTGGAAVSGEESKEAAIRELREETGIIAEPEKLVYLGEMKGGDAFIDTYLYILENEQPELKLQKEEVVDACFVTFEELINRKEHMVESVWRCFNNFKTQLKAFTNTFAYEEATSEDAALLVSLYNAAFYEDYIKYGECPAYGRTLDGMKESIKRYPKQIIRYRHVPVGVISVKVKENGELEIGCLCVIPKYQRMGIGSKALAYIRRLHDDWKKITLITPMDKKQNIRFYTERNGFRIDGIEKDGTVRLARLVMER